MATTSSMKKEIAKRSESNLQTPSQLMNKTLNSNKMQELLDTTLKEKKGAFMASIIDLYGNNKTLSKCDAGDVVKEALKAVSLDLTINRQMGFVWIIPYKDNKTGKYVPTFQLGYKGYIQLCMRSGVYRTINAGIVYEGETVDCDKLSGLATITGVPTGDTPVGYFAYFQTLNGFEKCMYWTREDVIKHAEKYSKAYQQNSDIWHKNFDEMATKTVLRNLLSHYGLMSVALVNQLSVEEVQEYDDAEEAQTVQDPNTIEIDADTGEIKSDDTPLPWEQEN